MSKVPRIIVSGALVLSLILGVAMAAVIGSGDPALGVAVLLGLAVVSAGLRGTDLVGFGPLVRRRTAVRTRRLTSLRDVRFYS